MNKPKIPEGKFFIKFLLCGALTALPYVFSFLWFISWFALTPVIFMLLKYGGTFRKSKAYLYGLGFGFGYFGVMYHWFTCLYPMDFAGLEKAESLILVAVCWIGLASVQALEIGFVPLFYRLIKPDKNKPVTGALLFTALWVVFEWQESFGWRGVPWARLAVTQNKVIMLQQSASLFGSLFTGGIIVLVNSLLAVAVLYAKENQNAEKFFLKIKNKKTVLISVAALTVFLVNFLFGVIRIAVYDENKGVKVKAGVIQGNISSLEKWADNAVSQSTMTYLDLTGQCVKETGAKIVVWPETVIPISLMRSDEIMRKISNTANELDITLFVGAFDDEYDPETDTFYEYNAIYIFYPDGSVGDTRYYKRHLVPFGEYTPMEPVINTLLPVLADMNILSDPLTPGDCAEIFETEYGKVGGLVCFDSIYQMLTVDSVRDGAELIVLSTNDSWFRDSAAVYQHNCHAALRAIESGRFVVRAANTGVSSVITPEGKMRTEVDPLISGYTAETVSVRSDRTLYSYVGDLFVYLCIAFIVFLIFKNMFLKFSENRNS